MYPPLMWQSPGPAAAVSATPMCMGIGTSTLPSASCANASSTASVSALLGATLALMVS